MVEARTGHRGLGTREERRAHWEEHIERWRQSGQSKSAYCRTHELNPASFYRWLGKLGDGPKKTPGFIPVRLPKGSPTYPIEVTLGNGVVMRLGNEADGTLIRQLLSELRQGC